MSSKDVEARHWHNDPDGAFDHLKEKARLARANGATPDHVVGVMQGVGIDGRSVTWLYYADDTLEEVDRLPPSMPNTRLGGPWGTA